MDDLNIESASQVAKAQAQSQPTTKDNFWKKWWFTPYHVVEVLNPQSYDYKFLVEGRPFVVKAGGTQNFPGPVANLYLSNMSRIWAQDEDKFEHMSDFNLVESYYERLVVNSSSFAAEGESVPEYMKDVPVQLTGVAETPPWQEPAPVAPVAPTAPVVLADDGEVREFESEGSKYRSILSKKGSRMFYRDGQLTTEAVFSKAASLV